MKFIKTGTITLIAVFLGVALVSLGQFAQAAISLAELRQHKLSLWAGADMERIKKTEAFTKRCLIGGPVETSGEIERPVSINSLGIENCANSNGYDELVGVIKEADDTLQSFAWPLSAVDKLVSKKMIRE